jgi:microcystin-dependent protein
MSDQYLGEIRLVGFNFAPYGWAQCNGQILAIAQNTALYSLLGTYYGGNGTSTFALPNLQSRVVVGMGQGTGLSPYSIGQTGGTENTTLLANNLPTHTHPFAISANSTTGDTNNPSNAYPGLGGDSQQGPANVYTQSRGSATMAPQMTGPTGNSVPFSVLQPYIAMNYVIALQGIYPSRN